LSIKNQKEHNKFKAGDKNDEYGKFNDATKEHKRKWTRTI